MTDDAKDKTVRELLKEYLKRLNVIETEMSVLKEDKKTLDEEFKDKLDLKTLKQALRVHNILKDIKHKDTYDQILDMLEKEMQ